MKTIAPECFVSLICENPRLILRTAHGKDIFVYTRYFLNFILSFWIGYKILQLKSFYLDPVDTQKSLDEYIMSVWTSWAVNKRQRFKTNKICLFLPYPYSD